MSAVKHTEMHVRVIGDSVNRHELRMRFIRWKTWLRTGIFQMIDSCGWSWDDGFSSWFLTYMLAPWPGLLRTVRSSHSPPSCTRTLCSPGPWWTPHARWEESCFLRPRCPQKGLSAPSRTWNRGGQATGKVVTVSTGCVTGWAIVQPVLARTNGDVAGCPSLQYV